MTSAETNSDELMKELMEMVDILEDQFLTSIAISTERRVKIQITEEKLVDTGRFRSSVQGRKVGPGEILISDGVTYGIYHELGTGVHGPKGTFIRPKNKKALVFESKNYVRSGNRVSRQVKTVFTTRVRGVPAKAPFKKAIEHFEEDLDKNIRMLLGNYFEQ